MIPSCVYLKQGKSEEQLGSINSSLTFATSLVAGGAEYDNLRGGI